MQTLRKFGTLMATTLQKYKLLMNEQIMAKKNAKTAGCRGTLANTHDLVRIGLVVVVVRVAFSKVDVPGVISIVGNRGPGPENPSPFFVPLNKTVSGHHKDGTKTATINCGRKI